MHGPASATAALHACPAPSATDRQGRAEFISMWAGQAAGLARVEPASKIVHRLAAELDQLTAT